MKEEPFFCKQYASLFYAETEDGRQLPFSYLPLGDRILLELKKELFATAKTLRVLPALGRAKVGEEGYFITPREISCSGDIQTFFTPREDAVYCNPRPIMSCYGIKRAEYSCLVRLERNYHYQLELKVENGVYTVCARYDFTDHEPVWDDIRIELVPLDPETGDYNQMARTERRLRLERGEIVPLRQKCEKPAVEYARRYPLIRIRMGWKPSPSPVLVQTEANEPEMFVACDFAGVRRIADRCKAAGIEGAEFQLVGWNRSGHDGRFPQLFPADPRLGGDEGLRETIAYVKSLGYHISTHTNTIDAFPIADTFDWNDVAVDRQGNYLQIGHYSGGYAYHVCMRKQWKNTLRDLPAVAAVGENGLHFTDVISIVIPDDCHAKDHVSYVSDGILYAQKIMAYTRGLFGGFSSEGAMDFALKDLDYALYVCFGDGFGKKPMPLADRLIPFFEVAYHGILLYNPTSPTVNYPLKDARERLTMYLRGGRPCMYYYSKFRTGGAINWMGESDLVCGNEEALRDSVEKIGLVCREYAPFADRQLVYMAGYDILENGLEVARYEDGVRVVGNFTDAPLSYGGKTVSAWDFIVVS